MTRKQRRRRLIHLFTIDIHFPKLDFNDADPMLTDWWSAAILGSPNETSLRETQRVLTVCRSIHPETDIVRGSISIAKEASLQRASLRQGDLFHHGGKRIVADVSFAATFSVG